MPLYRLGVGNSWQPAKEPSIFSIQRAGCRTQVPSLKKKKLYFRNMNSVINSNDFLGNSAARGGGLWRVRKGRGTRVWKVSRGSQESEGEDS